MMHPPDCVRLFADSPAEKLDAYPFTLTASIQVETTGTYVKRNYPLDQQRFGSLCEEMLNATRSTLYELTRYAYKWMATALNRLGERRHGDSFDLLHVSSEAAMSTQLCSDRINVTCYRPQGAVGMPLVLGLHVPGVWHVYESSETFRSAVKEAASDEANEERLNYVIRGLILDNIRMVTEDNNVTTLLLNEVVCLLCENNYMSGADSPLCRVTGTEKPRDGDTDLTFSCYMANRRSLTNFHVKG